MLRIHKPIFIKILIIIASVLAVLLISSLVYVKFAINGKFSPKTFVAGIDISGKTMDEAAGLLEESGTKFATAKIPIKFQDKTATIAVKDLHPQILIEQTLKTIKETDGRNFGILGHLFPQKYEEKNSPLIVSIDENATLKSVDKAFGLSQLEPKSASFQLSGGGKLEIIPEHNGIITDHAKTISDLKNRIANLSTKSIEIAAISADPLISSAMLEQQKDDLYKKMNYSVTLEDPIYTDDWNVRLKDHLDWVSFSSPDNYCLPLINSTSPDCTKAAQQKIQFQINPEAFNAFIDKELSKWLDKPAQNVEIKERDDKKVTIAGHGNDGYQIKRDSLRGALELAIENSVAKITIPVATTPPQITVANALKEKGIKEKLAIGHTSYYGSPANRVFNIKVAAAKLDGTLIPPGETFSFNKTIGAVNGATGYRKELVIKKEGTVPDYGGGVCQVSTTVYRSALFSGLPIVERNEHSYAVSYYSQILGHGLDATIYIGGPDLRFTNDTGHYLAMQAYVDPDYELYIILYGTSDGRSVEMEGPYISNRRSPPATIYEETTELAPGQTKETEHAHAGFSVLWYRYLTDKAGVTATEEIKTTYRAMPAKILVGKAAEAVPAP